MTPAAQGERWPPLRIRRWLFAGFFFVLLATAWVADDAYISFRTLDHLLAGRGLVWNLGERVQAFTHPLWFFLHVLAVAASGEVYYTTLVLCVACSLAAVHLLAFRVAATPAAGAAAILALLLSAGFVDYSTSGLENPLTHLLLGVMVAWGWREDGRPGRLLIAAAAAALLGLNRLDLLALAVPGLLLPGRRATRRERVLAACVVVLPLAAWHLFSLAYFGFLVPNTAPAKLASGVALGGRLLQGIAYLGSATVHDGLTVAIGAWILVRAVRRGTLRDRLVVLSVAGYLAYLVGIGGDSMSGRFLTPPFFLLLLVAASTAGERLVPERRRRAALVLGTLLAIRLVAHAGGSVDAVGVGDERRVWYPFTGLWLAIGERNWPEGDWTTVPGPGCPPPTCHRIETVVGLYGYYAAPEVVIFDRVALTDPVRARLPGLRDGDYNWPGRPAWRPAHIERPLPADYIDSVLRGEIRVADPDLAAFMRAVWLVTRGPLWTRERWQEIWRLNTGGYRETIRRWVARHPDWYPVEAARAAGR